jgi:hypothetical protein
MAGELSSNAVFSGVVVTLDVKRHLLSVWFQLRLTWTRWVARIVGMLRARSIPDRQERVPVS